MRATASARDRSDDYTGELIDVEGLLDLRDEGYGFLRTSGYLAGRNDAYVSASQVRRFGLRKGDYVKGATRPPASSEKYPALVRVDLINDMTPDEARSRVRFEDLTPLFPDSQLRLELDDDPGEITGRIIDLISPIGKGQRGMIVSPPKAGKTTIIKQIVYSIERNNPECTSSCCSSTSGPKRSPTCAATCCAPKSSRRRSTVPPTSTATSPSSRSSAPSASSRWATTS